MLVHLPSVASYIDTTDALVYAAYQRGGVDTDSARHVSECSNTFHSLLTTEEREIISIIERYQALHIKLLVR